MLLPIAILAILAILAIYLAICFCFSGVVIHPTRQPIVKSPEDYGMDYEDVEFKSSDGLNLKGWLIPGESDKIVIITHPGSFSRYGLSAKHQGLIRMAKKDVEFLRTAKVLNGEGYSVLMFDFRNHGESDKSKNNGITGVGLNEYQDVVGAVNYIGNRPDLVAKKIGFVSFCMGANSTIIAMSRARSELGDVKCLVAVQPISVDVFVRSYVRDTYTQLGAVILVPLVDRISQWRGGYPLKEMSPKNFVKDIYVPTLYVQARSDPWAELSDIQGFYEQTPEPKKFLMLDEKMARFDTYNYFGDHPEKLLEFLEKHL